MAQSKKATNTKQRSLTFADARDIAMAFPGIEVGTSYGTPSLRVKRKFMARLRDDDPDVLVLVQVEELEKDFLMATQPEAFFTTDHYRAYPSILIRLSKVDRGQLAELIERSWRRLAPARLVAAHDASMG